MDIYFVISDSGEGIDPEYLPALFEPFAQGAGIDAARRGNTGLGLAISKKIIALTANAMDEEIRLSFAAGMNAHLTKPIEPDDLFSVLKSLL